MTYSVMTDEGVLYPNLPRWKDAAVEAEYLQKQGTMAWVRQDGHPLTTGR